MNIIVNRVAVKKNCIKLKNDFKENLKYHITQYLKHKNRFFEEIDKMIEKKLIVYFCIILYLGEI